MPTELLDADVTSVPADRASGRVFATSLLVLAGIAVLCVPGIVGIRTNGVAAVAPPAPPPAVGQCRAEITKIADLGRMTGLAIVPCHQPHSAEIVSLGTIETAEYPTTTQALADQQAVCSVAVGDFVGGRSTDPFAHQPPMVSGQIVVPNRAQWDSGQRWYACQIRPLSDTIPVSYTGTARSSSYSQNLHPAFGYCANNIGGEPISCNQPHVAEQLSIPAAGNPNCLAIGAEVIGRVDPTFGSGISLTGWRYPDGSTSCWATPTTSLVLTGTLIGWGEKSLEPGR